MRCCVCLVLFVLSLTVIDGDIPETVSAPKMRVLKEAKAIVSEKQVLATVQRYVVELCNRERSGGMHIHEPIAKAPAISSKVVVQCRFHGTGDHRRMQFVAESVSRVAENADMQWVVVTVFRHYRDEGRVVTDYGFDIAHRQNDTGEQSARSTRDVDPVGMGPERCVCVLCAYPVCFNRSFAHELVILDASEGVTPAQ